MFQSPIKHNMKFLSPAILYDHKESTMQSFFIFVAAVIIASSATAKPHERIVGGQQAEKGQFPYQVQIQYLATHYCGGSVISADWIVTACHCADLMNISYVVVANQYNVAAAEGDERRHAVSRVIRHPGFSYVSYENDIALMKLNPPLEFDKWVQPIPLPPAMHTPSDGSIGTVTGWGSLVENGLPPRFLRYAEIPIISDEQCGTAYKGRHNITTNMICAYENGGGKDSCQGDSGGPLVVAGDLEYSYLSGIISFGIGCGRPEFPGVYTEVSHYIDWIQEEMAKS